MVKLNTIYNEDCLEGMKRIPDESVDMILCDLPYGTTACKWDTIIPFETLWAEYERVIKSNGAIVLTAAQPFTSALVMSNPKWFKYEWVWEKTRFTGNLNAKIMPLRAHENVLVFGRGRINYYPIKTQAPEHKIDRRKTINDSHVKAGGAYNNSKAFVNKRTRDDGTRYPTSVQVFKNPNNNSMHPTQKPVLLFEYLIKTYTNKGETILDNCMGSGTTAIACLNTDRQYIGFELDEGYYKMANKRIENHTQQLSLIEV